MIKKINGVNLQTILTVCERTFTLGYPIMRKPVMVNVLDIMGLTFIHEQHSYQRTYQKRNVQSVTSNMKHFLRGENWEVMLVFGRKYPGDLTTYEIDPKTGLIIIKTLPTPPDWLRWGREAYFFYIEHRLSGDAEAFSKAMLYAQMIGGEHADWDEVRDLLN